MSLNFDDTEDGERFFERRSELRTSRGRHRCCACGCAIPASVQYQFTLYYNTLLDTYEPGDDELEGVQQTWIVRRCSRCEAIYRHLCELMEKSDRRLYQSVAPELDCGLEYEDEWGKMPAEAQELAFLLPGEQPGALLGLEAG